MNPSLLDYRKLTAADLPNIETIIVEVPSPSGPFGARGVGSRPSCRRRPPSPTPSRTPRACVSPSRRHPGAHRARPGRKGNGGSPPGALGGGRRWPKLKVWITFGDRLKFGDGRAQLLELIDERGSLRKAASELGMSYRNAWGYLRELEEAAGFTFLERVPGGGAQRHAAHRRGQAVPPALPQFRSALDGDLKRHFERTYAKKETA